MNLYKRKESLGIAGFSYRALKSILRYDEYSNSLPKVDTIIADNILLDNGKRVKCIYNYYLNKDHASIKKQSGPTSCFKVQKHFGVQCRQFRCETCHLQLLNQLEDKTAFIKTK